MNKKTNKIGNIIVGSLLIIGIIIMFYKKEQFIQDYKFTMGRITKVTITGWKSSGDYSVFYLYNINGKKYSNDESLNFCGNLNMSKVRALLENKNFPIAYSAKDESTCTILLTLENAQKFKYTFSDTLLRYDSILTCK